MSRKTSSDSMNLSRPSQTATLGSTLDKRLALSPQDVGVEADINEIEAILQQEYVDYQDCWEKSRKDLQNQHSEKMWKRADYMEVKASKLRSLSTKRHAVDDDIEYLEGFLESVNIIRKKREKEKIHENQKLAELISDSTQRKKPQVGTAIDKAKTFMDRFTAFEKDMEDKRRKFEEDLLRKWDEDQSQKKYATEVIREDPNDQGRPSEGDDQQTQIFKGKVTERQFLSFMESYAASYVSDLIKKAVDEAVKETADDFMDVKDYCQDASHRILMNSISTNPRIHSPLEKVMENFQRIRLVRPRSYHLTLGTYPLGHPPQYLRDDLEEWNAANAVCLSPLSLPKLQIPRNMIIDESQKWSLYYFEPFEITIPTDAIQCLCFDHRGVLLALGTITGVVHVLHLDGQSANLVAQYRPSTTTGSCTRLSWSIESSRLLVCYENISVHVIGMSSEYSVKAGIVSQKGDPGIMELREIAIIDKSHLLKVYADLKTEIVKEMGDDFENVRKVENDFRISAATFHPAFTAFFTQSSFMVGTECGTMFRINVTTGQQKITYGASVLPQNKTIEYTLVTPQSAKVAHELFREHKAPIVFVDFINYDPYQIISIDVKGLIIIWEYNERQFLDIGWFHSDVKYYIENQEKTYIPIKKGKGPEEEDSVTIIESVGKKVEEIINSFGLSPSPWLATPMGLDGMERLFVPANIRSAISGDQPVDIHALVTLGEKVQSHTKKKYKEANTQGRISQVEMRANRSDIVVMIDYPQSGPINRFLSFELLAIRDKLLSLCQPRIRHSLDSANTSSDIFFRLSSVFSKDASDYLYLSTGASIVIYSLSTGMRVRDINQPVGSLGLVKNLAVNNSHTVLAMASTSKLTVECFRIRKTSKQNPPQNAA